MTSDGQDPRTTTEPAVTKPGQPDERPKRGRIDAQARHRLGLSLRLHYADIQDQPLPERFTQLLEKLSQTPSREGDAS